MKINLFTMTLIFALLLTPAMLMAQSPRDQGDWNTVQAVTIGSKLRIESKSGEHTEGKLQGISDTGLTLDHKGKAVTFNRTDIRKVYRLEAKSRTKSTLLGTAIGAGAGLGTAAVLLAATGGSDETSRIMTTGAAIGAGLGTAIGAAIPKGTKRVLIYEAK